jgi:transketolase
MAEMSMRESYGQALASYGEANPNVVVLDADTSSSTFSSFFARRYPDRFVNIGIAEPCMVDVAVGLALGGFVPFVNGFAALLALRAMEQIRTCVCYAGTNVKLAAGYAGLSDYKDGPTHHSIVDLALMRALPGMTVIVPADAVEVSKWVPVVAEHDGPVYLRISRAATLPMHDGNLEVKVGKGLVLRDGDDVTLVATGSMVGRCKLAAEELAREGVDARVLEMHTIKPFAVDLVRQAAKDTEAIVTAEEHSIVGGLGGAVAECLAGHLTVPLERVGVDDLFTCTALDVDSLMDAYGLAVEDVVTAAKRAVTQKRSQAYS